MAQATYLASRISPNQFETPTEGYRICRSVRICRTGSQDYLGSELKRHPNYDPNWGLDDSTLYAVQRPISEVTNAQTVASFEGKTVVDEHPPEHIAPGSLISIESERELSCGHIQNVRIGPQLVTGETPLLGDLHIKDGTLIDKVDGGVRDISCGYTYTLKRLGDGTFIQTNIRGNHIAIVPQGRAGSDISIQDAMPQLMSQISPTSFFEGVPYRVGLDSYKAHVAATSSAASPSPSSFFEGVPYKVGKARYEAHVAAQGGK